MGVIGSAKLLQAIARDHIVPGLSIFGYGSLHNDEPIYAILITYTLAQITMLFDINQIASFVTMAYLMTFLVTNLACFLLKISSAPNFRPSFRFFNWQTAALGTVISGAAMFFVDGFYATGFVGLLIIIFLVIHYTTPPKSWGDVSQSLIYHQVRKYLLRLRQEHVKFWRPQVLLLINDPRRQYKLIQFCNALKKGALFVLGHIIVSDDFGGSVPEARKQQIAWMKYVDFSRVKAFIDIAIAPTLEWGARNLLMNSGLGGMRPNIVVIGLYNLELFRSTMPLINVRTPRGADPSRRDSDEERAGLSLPTDTNREEREVTPAAYVTILEDFLHRMKINVAIAKGFNELELPTQKKRKGKKYIDLWPIQMSARISTDESTEKQNILTSNFDTYTLILQLGAILNTVTRWKKAYTLRVAVFVEYESDVQQEETRLRALLTRLRIKAEILVFWLASGDVKSYQAIVNGNYQEAGNNVEVNVDKILDNEDWWQEIQRIRGRRRGKSAIEQLAAVSEESPDSPVSLQNWKIDSFPNLRKLVRSLNRRRSTSHVALGPRMSMTTQHLDDEILNSHAVYDSTSESSDSDDDVFETPNSARDLETDPFDSRSRSASEEDRSRGRRSRAKSPEQRSDQEPFQPLLAMLMNRSGNRQDENDQNAITPPEHTKIQKTLGADTPLKNTLSSLSALPVESRPKPSRRSSAAKFSSHPVPETTVAAEDGPGPSIMFAESDQQSPKKRSIYDRVNSSASGFPSPQSIPLSFNDLPARAQHLILNELIRQHSAETAVVFTTLPSPEEGTCQSEDDSLAYLSDLEVLCNGLPPTMLIQSNNVTVTVNL